MNAPAGDLLVIAGPDQQQKVKLYGIECPEKGQPFWDKARVLAAHLTNQKTVEVTTLYKGPEGYDKALVRVEGVRDYLNLQLVAHGMAWVKSNECSANVCAEWKGIEKLAQTNAVGLWAELNPIPPWEWKKQQRLKVRNHRDSSKDSSNPNLSEIDNPSELQSQRSTQQ